LSAAEATYGPKHPETSIIRMNLGDDYLYGLELDQAIEMLSASEAALTESNGANTLYSLSARTDLGFAYLFSGRHADALSAFERAAAGWAEALPKHPTRAMALLGRFQAMRATGKTSAPDDLQTALGLGGDLPPFELGRVQLEAALATRDEKLLAAARENLKSIGLPLIAAELKRADGAAIR
ncbi:MAG: tetratricopeptide repeat protein, partial [Myxococcaceae bacterium]|nr:tetratricopeptide repeat protein [Myxococcaceae bacterium]